MITGIQHQTARVHSLFSCPRSWSPATGQFESESRITTRLHGISLCVSRQTVILSSAGLFFLPQDTQKASMFAHEKVAVHVKDGKYVSAGKNVNLGRHGWNFNVD